MSQMQQEPVRRVLKFQLNTHGLTVLHMPIGYKVLAVAFQGGDLMVWIEYPEGQDAIRKVCFASLFTGFDAVPRDMDYVGTATITGLVVHVYTDRTTVPQRRQEDYQYRNDPL